jgi:hypothetical protein
LFLSSRLPTPKRSSTGFYQATPSSAVLGGEEQSSLDSSVEKEPNGRYFVGGYLQRGSSVVNEELVFSQSPQIVATTYYVCVRDDFVNLDKAVFLVSAGMWTSD